MTRAMDLLALWALLAPAPSDARSKVPIVNIEEEAIAQEVQRLWFP